MVSVDLDPDHESRLSELARAQGEDAAFLARRILMDYLDFEALPEKEDDRVWATASVAMAAKFMEPEDWREDTDDDSR